MFTSKDLRSLDRKYFTVTQANYCAVTIISKNTNHLWHLEHTGFGVKIWHSHKPHDRSGFHYHGRARTLGDAIEQIRSHDRWQMNGRK